MWDDPDRHGEEVDPLIQKEGGAPEQPPADDAK